MTRHVRRRSVLAATVPLLVSACFRREDGTQPGMGADTTDVGTAADDSVATDDGRIADPAPAVEAPDD
ncbi:hypothetical protein [Natronobeatus ordinarius]|uniref:hypothetical protein n=1 Tax=Natronobeatus ordinarius TaxID=2963433 RepID=UPI0020CC31DA|nr:hypothetical protein [Natronobeatus ordinarius]